MIIRKLSPAVYLFLLFAAVPMVFFACSTGSTEANRGSGTSDDDDVDVPDDDIADDSDDDDDDDSDDTDDTTDDTTVDDDTTQQVASVLLKFDPDPTIPGQHFYFGQQFTMWLEMYTADDVLIGETTDYTLSIDPDAEGIYYDTEARFIKFTPPSADTFSVTATYEDTRINSQTVDIKIEFNDIATIILMSPTHGLFTQDSEVTVEGTCQIEYSTPSPCPKVLVNGTAATNAPVPGESYSHFLHSYSLDDGLNRLEIVAQDSESNPVGDMKISVLHGPYVENDAMTDYAVGARINEGGLDSVETIAEEYISTFDLNEYLAGGSFDVDLGLCTLSLGITNAEMGPTDVALDAIFGGIHLEAAVQDLSIDATVSGCAFDTSGTLTVDALISTDIAIWANPDGTLGVLLSNTDVDISNAEATGFDDLGSLIDSLLSLVGPVIGDLLGPYVDEMVQPIIEDALGDLDLSGSFDMLGKTFSLEALFQDVATSEDGFTIWMKASFIPETPDPSVPTMPGSFHLMGAHPDMGPETPLPPVAPYDFGVALNDDILNQALYAMFRSGLLNYEFTDPGLTTTTLLLLFPQVFIAYPNCPVILRLEALLQPVITYEFSTTFTPRFAIGEYMFRFFVEDPEVGEVQIFAADISLVFPIGISIDDDGLLHIDITENDFDVDVYVFEMLTGMHISDTLVEDFIPGLLEFLIPYLGDLLGGIALPTFEGYTIDIESLQAFGAGNDYLGIFGSLVAVP